MVYVDLEILHEIANITKILSSKSDDTLGRLQMLNNEMSYDANLLLYPQSQTLLQNMSDAINQMRVADDILNAMKNILIHLPEEYEQIERSGESVFETNLEKLRNVNIELVKIAEQNGE